MLLQNGEVCELFKTSGYSFNRMMRPLILLLVITLLTSPFASVIYGSDEAITVDEEAVIGDIQGHWAEAQIQSWLDQGWLFGYPDNTIRPDREITRAEFASMVNRVFQYDSMAIIDFSDVSDEWFVNEIAKAVAAGYYSGYPDGTIRPNHPISRQEVAAVVARILGKSSGNPDAAIQSFSDADHIAWWSKGAIASVTEAGIMQGYPNGTFQPAKEITRAEAVAALERTRKAWTSQLVEFDQPGVYGSGDGSEPQMIKGDVVVSVPGVTLKNMVIDGDLLLGKGIGEGDVTLDHVAVYGLTTMNGGGGNSVHIQNSTLNQVVIDKVDGNIRVVVSGTTVVREVALHSGANLEEIDLTDEGFGTISVNLTKDGEVILSGDFEYVRVQTPGVAVEIKRGSVQNLDIDEQAAGTKVHVQEDASVERLILNAASDVTGNGSIHTAEVNAKGSSFEREPKELVLAGQAGPDPIENQEAPPATTPIIIPPDGDILDSHPADWVSGETAIVPDYQGSGQAAVARKYSLMSDGAKIDIRGSTIAIAGQETEGLLDYPHEDLWISLDADTTDLHLLITTEQGMRYEATLKREQATEVTVSFQGPSEAGAVFTGRDAFDHARIDFREAQVNQLLDWTSIKMGYYAVELKLDGADLRADHVIKAFRVHEDGVIVELSNEERDYDIQYVTTDWHVGTAALYFVLADQSVYVAHVNVISLTPAEQVIQYVSTDGPTAFDVFVPWGTSSLAAHEALPQSISVTGNVNEKSIAAIDWNIIDYNESIAGTYTAAGHVILPASWIGSPDPVTATVTVVPVSIHTEVRSVSPGGFTLAFNSAIAGLAANDVKIEDDRGNVVTITSVEAVDEGASYHVQAQLIGGQSYTLEVTKTGYVFNTVNIPVPRFMTMTAERPDSNGFTLTFSEAVPDLKTSELGLVNTNYQSVAFSLAPIGSDGKAYKITADLSTGLFYYLNFNRTGYQVNPDWGIIVAPSQYIQAQVSEVSVDGFTLTLTSALSGLNGQDFLIEEGGQQFGLLSDAVSSSDNGKTYRFNKVLELGKTYLVKFMTSDYTFEPEVSFTVRTTSVLATVTDVNQAALAIQLSPALIGLTNVTIQESGGEAVTIASVSSQDLGNMYNVLAALTGGKNYIVTLAKDGYDFGEPLSVTVPEMVVSADVGDISIEGFVITFSKPIKDLQKQDFNLLTAAEGQVEVTRLIASNGDKTYEVSAALSWEGIYRFDLTKPGYKLATPVSVSVPAIVQVEKTISHASTSGLTIALSPAVVDLTAAALDLRDADNRPVSGATMSSADNGATYIVKASMTGGKTYSVNLEKEGYSFGDNILVDVPISEVSVAVQPQGLHFIVTLDPAVPGLTEANISIHPEVHIESVTSHSAGAIYTVSANYMDDTQYQFTLTQEGYDFGDPVNALYQVPMKVTDVDTTGFTLLFNPPAPNLTKNQVWVISKGTVFDAEDIHTNDEGASYRVKYTFVQGSDYTIGVSSQSGAIGSPVSVTAPWTPKATINNVSTSGFTLMLDGVTSGLELTTEHISLTTLQGAPVSIRILDTNGIRYQIAADLSIGQSYNLAINNTPGYNILGLPALLPEVAQAVSVSISNVSIDGFNIHLSPSIDGLTEENVILRNIYGNEELSLRSMTTTDDGVTYWAEVELQQNLPYTLSLHSSGFLYYFDQYSITPQVVWVTAATSEIHPTGFTVMLNSAVRNLTAASFKVCERTSPQSCTSIVDVATNDNRIFLVNTQLARGKEYVVAIERSGFIFTYPDLFFKIPVVKETIEITETSATGITVRLSPALDGITKDNIQLRDGNNVNVYIESVGSVDGGETYGVKATLQPGGSYSLLMTKAGYDFGSYTLFRFIQKVTTTTGEADETGFTIHLNPAMPGLTPGHLFITDAQDQPIAGMNKTLITTDGGASYRAGISLRGGKTYKLAWSNPSGYIIEPGTVDVPELNVSGTVADPSETGFVLRFSPAVPGLKASDITLRDEQGQLVTVTGLVARNNGAAYLIEAMLLGGTTYTVQPAAFGYNFGDGYEVAVPLAVRQTATAWFAGIALDLSSAVPGLTADEISLKDRQGREIAVQSVSMIDSGAAYLIKAELIPNSFYDLQLTKNGFKFEQLSVRAGFLSSQLKVEAETNNGFTLVFEPAVADLRPTDLTIIDATNGQEITLSGLSSIDGGRTYTVSADLVYGRNYRINIKPYGYTTISEAINLTVIVGRGITPTLTETGFTFTLNPAVDGLVPADLILTGPDGTRVAVTGLTTPDGGSTYLAQAALLPGGRHKLGVQPAGYNFGAPAGLQAPPPTVNVINATAEEIVLKFTPAVPDLDASNFSLQGLGGLQFDLASATSANGGASYLLHPTEPLPDGAQIGIFLTKAFFNLGPTITAELPYRVTLSISDVRAGSFTLHLDRPVSGLSPEEVTLTDERNAVFRPYALAGNFNGDTWEVKIDLAGGQTYSLALDAPDLAAEPISVAFPARVMPAITGVTGEGFILALSPAVDGLDLTDLLLTPIGSQTPLAIRDLTTADMGVTYKAQVALTPGQVYDLSLVKAGHDFLRTVRFGFGLPPVLTDAFISADGASLLLAFDKPMAVPLNAPAGFTVTVDGATQSFTGVKAGNNSNELVLGLAAAIEGGSIALTYIAGSIQAADNGQLEEIPFLAVHHLAHVEGLAIFLRGQGHTLAQIGEALRAQLNASRKEIAQGLADLRYSALDIATVVMAAYSDSTAADMTATLKHAGQDSSAVVAVLGLRFGVPIAQTPVLLQGAGYSVLEITQSLADDRLTATQAAEALSSANLGETATEKWLIIAASLQVIYGATDAAAAQVLFDVDAPVDVALEALTTVYGSDLSTGAKALEAGGYGADLVAAALIAHYDVVAAEVTNVLTGAGYTAVQIAAALEAGFAGLTLPDVLPLLWAAGHEVQAIATVLVDRTYTAAEAYHLLKAAGYGLDSLMQILAQGYGPSATAEGLKGAGMAFDEIGSVLQRNFYLTAAQAGAVLHQAGYSMDEAAQVLHPVYRLKLRNLGDILLSNFRQTYEEVVVAFRKAGVGIAAVSQYLREVIGAGGHLDQTGAGMLKAAGYDVAEVTVAVRSFIAGYSGGVPANVVAKRLRSAGYTAAEAIQGLRAAYSDDREAIVCAVSYAYDVDEAVAGVVAHWGVDPGSVARWIRNGNLVRLENYLPLSTYDVGQLLRDHLGPGPAGLINALRAEGFAIGYTGDVMRAYYDGYQPAQMLTGLRTAGYPVEEIIGYLEGSGGGGLLNSSVYKAAGVTASELGAYMLSQGFTARQFAIELEAYDALEIALAIRSVYNLDAAAATAALLGISGGRYSEQAVAEAVGTAYQVDVILMVASGARANGDTAAAAAWMLKQVYRLELLTAAKNLRGAGYSQAEVLQGILSAYCGEAKWSADIYRSLTSVLTDVYGVVDTVAKPLAVLQAIGANLTPSDQVYMMRQWSFSWTEVAEVLRGAQFSPGTSLELMRDFAPIPTDEMWMGVAAAYAITRTEALADWLRLKQGAGAGPYAIAGWLAYPGNLGWQDIATQLQALGYTRTEVINAIKYRWSGPDAYMYPAWISHVLFEVTDLGSVLKEMYRAGSQPSELKDALTYLYPNMNLGEKALLLRKAGLSTSQLVTWVLQLEPKDDSVYPILKQLGLTATDSFHYVLGRWDVPIVERVSILDGAGYTPAELFFAISSDAVDVVRGYNQIDKPIREVAYGLSMYWYGKIRLLSAEEIASNLYEGGYTLDQVAYAMAPPRIAYDSDIVPAGEYRGAPLAEYGCSIIHLVPQREIGKVALAIARAKVNRNTGSTEQYPMDLTDIAFFLYSCPSITGMGPKSNAIAVWDGLKAITSTQVWKNSTSRLGESWSQNKIVLRSLLEVEELSSYTAAHVLRAKGYTMNDAWVEMMSVGLDFWTARVSVTDAYPGETAVAILSLIFNMALKDPAMDIPKFWGRGEFIAKWVTVGLEYIPGVKP